MELIFLASNGMKILEGGWLPLAFGALIRVLLFEFMFRNASSAANYFCLPTARVVELGSRVMI